MDIDNFKNSALKAYDENRRLIKSIKKKKYKNLDKTFRDLHEEVFEEIDCLTCANCCKTTSPIFYQMDIERVAKSLRSKPSAFIDEYLRIDEDGDDVLKQSPCPFLGNDNKCIVYDSRPTACREYPHTNRKRMYQILNLTLKNSMVCPAVLEIFERLKKTSFLI
ncbi:YkgJ family cysteine cluster protein [Fulvivirgaceae bacterium BMA10]|uniref:YkgJ family cysteine cluster protein n=1 Tax=Splendidivirga corallicola TaxID=3051826 RepID=A0ABT8KV51_9BACT|nr:YkgJ family cysteine cluster protein [Fulvivirgaceae bacterium BMA10]